MEQPRTVGERLRYVREEQKPKVTQRDAAKLLGIKEETYRSYEYDRSQLPEDLAKRLGTEWAHPWKWFYQGDDEPPFKFPVPQLEVPIPRIGPTSAGKWSEPTDSEEFYEVPPKMAVRGAFCSPVEGDSMYDLLWPNDMAVFKRDDAPSLGTVVIARNLKTNGLVIKQLKHNGTNYILHPLNPRHEDIIAGPWQVLGFLIGIIREDGDENWTRFRPSGIRP